VVSKSGFVLGIPCREAREELTNYLEGDVTPELRARIEWHLAKCTSCCPYYDSVRRLIRMLGETRLIELPAGFSQRLYSRLVNL
jgi:predicted anti-sigma-YlaC factor YlaD